ncbi:MAG: hypothetical protein QOH21_2154, partial [Acidobacteriota bacterium]|nr:hypothetical protein [Acidobacteriota bacterium]
IDGQVYGVRYLPLAAAAVLGNPPTSETANPNAPPPPPTDFGFNPWDFVSLLVWNAYDPPAEPKWYPDIQPMFQQYGNLYPFMDTIIDLTSYDAVAANAGPIATVFGLSPNDPHYMPVTRDLSAAKQQTIIRWLTTPGPDGKPLQGTAPVTPAKAAPAAPLAAAPPLDDPDPLGSKKLAMRTRGT